MSIIKNSTKKDFDRTLSSIEQRFLEISSKYPKILAFVAFCLGYIAAVVGRIFFVLVFIVAIAVLVFYLVSPDSPSTEEESSENN